MFSRHSLNSSFPKKIIPQLYQKTKTVIMNLAAIFSNQKIIMNLSKRQSDSLPKIFRKHSVIFAYLFGSQAIGKADKKSDFDIAVMLPEKYGKNKRFNIRLELMADLSKILNYRKVDVIILNDISSLLFKYAIIHEGKVIYEKETAKRVDYATYIQSEYFDFAPFLDERNKLFLEKSV